MRDGRILIGVAVIFAFIAAASAPARAAGRMVVLIDASGSMSSTTERPGPTPGSKIYSNRFEDAKSESILDIRTLAMDTNLDPLEVAVYTFEGEDAPPVLHTVGGFVNYNIALDVIEHCLVSSPTSACPSPHSQVPLQFGGRTPLALSMCKSVDVLAVVPQGTARILQVSSDGEENSTVSDCAGPTGVWNGTTYLPGSAWQNQVIAKLTGQNISTRVKLFQLPGTPLSAPGAPGPEGTTTPEARARSLTLSPSTGPTIAEQFFTILARSTGGTLTVINDTAPLPVYGDLNGDRCVDRDDAILVAKAFGPITPPVDGTFDLNLDRTVDFADYQKQVARITTTCGPDPYVSMAPLVCKDATQIVIDGKAIEGRGITIDARGSCEIVIRNSLIVSGQNALTVVGNARITIDNSIVVGQSAVITQHGAGTLSAANTEFYGGMSFQGSSHFIDRGGNQFK